MKLRRNLLQSARSCVFLGDHSEISRLAMTVLNTRDINYQHIVLPDPSVISHITWFKRKQGTVTWHLSITSSLWDYMKALVPWSITMHEANARQLSDFHSLLRYRDYTCSLQLQEKRALFICEQNNRMGEKGKCQ